MLQRMHDKIQGLVAWVFAVIIALTFALWGVQNYLHGGTSSAAAKVNGEKITEEQFRSAYEQAKYSEMLRFGPDFSFDQKMQTKLKKDVLEHLIRQEVISQAEIKMGLGVTKRQLWAIVTTQPIFQVQGHFSLSNFQHLVRRMFTSEQAFFNNMKNVILRTQLEKGIMNTAFVLPNEIELIKKIKQQRRDFVYFTMPVERFMGKVSVDPGAMQKYYDEHHSEFLLPEKISIQYLELSADSFKKAAVTPEQLKHYYQSHIDAFSTPKKWQITRVLLPLSAKADAKAVVNAKEKIEEMAHQLKDAAKSTSIGKGAHITTSWVTRNDVPQDLTMQLDKLDVGKVSTPFRTKDGYNLIKVLARQEPKVTPYENVATKVRTAYEHQQLTQAFSEASDKLSDLVYTNSDSLEPAASELGLEIKETGLVTRAGKKEGILANNKITTAAFSDAVLKQRYNSNLIEVASGKMVVLRIKDYVPEKLLPLAQVQNSIVEKLQHEEAQKQASSLADDVLQALNSGKTEAEIAHQYNLIWRKLSGVKSDEINNVPPHLIDAAFSLPRPHAQKISATKINLEKGYAVLRLDRVYDEAAPKNDAEVNNTIKLLPEKFGQYEYQTLIDTLMRQAKIEVINKTEGERNISYEE